MALSKSTEREIESFLCENPYLIHKSFRDSHPVRQERIGRNRTDLTMRKKGLLTIVEIKRGVLNDAALHQLLDYIDGFRATEKLAPRHFLIGKKATHPEEFRQRAGSFGVDVLYLGLDIPPSFIYDTHRRIYIPYQSSLVGKPGYTAPVVFSFV